MSHSTAFYTRGGVELCEDKCEDFEEVTFDNPDCVGIWTVPCHVHELCIYAVGGGGGGGGADKTPGKKKCPCDYEDDEYLGSGGGGGQAFECCKKICVHPGDKLFFEVGRGGRGGGFCFPDIHGEDGTASVIWKNQEPPRLSPQIRRECYYECEDEKCPKPICVAYGGQGGEGGTEHGGGKGGAGSDGAGGGRGPQDEDGQFFGHGLGGSGVKGDGEDATDEKGGDGHGNDPCGPHGKGSICGGGAGGGPFGGSALPAEDWHACAPKGGSGGGGGGASGNCCKPQGIRGANGKIVIAYVKKNPYCCKDKCGDKSKCKKDKKEFVCYSYGEKEDHGKKDHRDHDSGYKKDCRKDHDHGGYKDCRDYDHGHSGYKKDCRKDHDHGHDGYDNSKSPHKDHGHGSYGKGSDKGCGKDHGHDSGYHTGHGGHGKGYDKGCGKDSGYHTGHGGHGYNGGHGHGGYDNSKPSTYKGCPHSHDHSKH